MRVVPPEAFPHRVQSIEHSWIPMADGTRLSAKLWIPESASAEPVPALLEYIPYRKRDQSRKRDRIHAAYLAGHGYAYARVDIRGSGDSEGHILDQYTEAELADGEQIIAWLAAQPWCNGRVGMMGISWGGFNALQIAARRPPALGAIVTVCSTDDTYVDNMHYMGGCLLSDNLSEATTMLAYQTLPPDPAIVGDDWRALWMERLETHEPWLHRWLGHQRRDDYWKPTSVCEDYGAIQVPVMTVGGWADGFTNAVFSLLAHLDVPRTGLIGPWSHKYPHTGAPGPAIGFLQEVRRWFGHWLGGEDNGVDDDPMLRVWMQDSMPPQFAAYEERRGRWVAEERWPSPHVETRRLPLDRGRIRTDGVKAEGSGAVSVQSPLTVGLSAGKWCSYAATPDLPGDQREDDGGSIVFESEPLTEPLEILGEPVVELEVAASRPVAQVAVRLSDVLPDDRVTRVTYGLLNLTHRDGHAEPKPLEPGERYRVRVTLNGVAQRFPAGNRLRVSVSSSYFPLVWPAPEAARITVFPEESALLLPVRPPRDTDARLRAFEAPEGAAPGERRVIRPTGENWRVIRDLATDEAHLEVVRHDEEWLVDSIGLRMRRWTAEDYRSRASDEATVRGDTHTIREVGRGPWRTRIETRSQLTSDPRRFHLHTTIDAYEGARRIFSRTFDRDFERDLV